MTSRDPYAYDVCGPKKLSTPGVTEIFSSSWYDGDHKRKVLACFVQAVYLLELDRQGNRTPKTALAPKWLEPSNYKLSETLVDERDGSIFGAVLEWAGYAVLRPRGAPKAILALRGNLIKGLTMIIDFTDDIRLFACENLEGSVRFSAATKALKSSVNRFGDCNVCIAGHSLGTGFAIQVGKAFAKQKVFIETHLFNLPSVSLECVWNNLKSIFAFSGEDDTGDEKVCATIMKWGLHFYVNKSDFLCSEADTEVIQNRSTSSCNSPAAKLFVHSKEKKSVSDAHGIMQWWEDGLMLKAFPNSKLIDRHLKSLMS
ncbi:GDSL esterase/lipase At4g10955-like [Papaver somniferum]|uniref:GDSL esterase/lipase At4g10955-like n=1 Tax=Papaver somniferum TaxID=3469 RepID=UPI000E6FE385|nr:GDSL esterase/lipase At4g10955-like [Papaver somniferum]